MSRGIVTILSRTSGQHGMFPVAPADTKDQNRCQAFLDPNLLTFYMELAVASLSTAALLELIFEIARRKILRQIFGHNTWNLGRKSPRRHIVRHGHAVQ